MEPAAYVRVIKNTPACASARRCAADRVSAGWNL